MNSSMTSTPASTDPTSGYLNALQVCAAILTMVLFGTFWTMVGRVSGKETIKSFNSFMFLVGIPCLVFRGLSLQRFDLMPWNFIAVFFCLRIALAAIWFVFDVLILRRSIRDYLSDYMCSTWINTVIFGIPIYSALFGPQFIVYPIFASISSFFFQLPLQLILFELTEKTVDSKSMPATLESEWLDSAYIISSSSHLPSGIRILFSILLNPILIAIVAGILFSLTGWMLPLYVDTFCLYCGTAVTPMAAFAIGCFMYRRHHELSEKKVLVFLAINLTIQFFLMPLLVIPFLLAFSITGVPLQMGVLMAALPVALSCYVLSVKYNSGIEMAALMVVCTTVLILPTQLMWIAIVDSLWPAV